MMGYLLRNRVLFVGSRINDEVRLLSALAVLSVSEHKNLHLV